MDHPYYEVNVYLLDQVGGFRLTSVEGAEADPDAPAALLDGLSYSWSFRDGQIPGHLEPATVTYSYGSTGPDVDPLPEIGEMVQVHIRLGTAPLTTLLNFVGRISDISTELRPGTRRPLRHAVTVVDLLADLRSRFPTPLAYGSHGEYWDQRLMFLSGRLGYRLGVPNAWRATEPVPHDLLALTPAWPESSADEIISSLLNTYAPQGIHHTLVPRYSASWPAGYKSIHYAFPEYGEAPNVPQRYLAVPAGRVLSGPHGLPFRFTILPSGLLGRTVTTNTAAMNKLPVVDAAWCRIPATARRSRDHDVNTIVVEGHVSGDNGPGSFSSGVTASRQRPDLGTAGARSRTVPTQQIVRFTPLPGEDWRAAAQVKADQVVDLIAETFMPDASPTAWSFDAFEIDASLVPHDVAVKLLPILIPRMPGDGDGTILRHLTLHNLPEEAQIAGDTITGFMTSGSLEIAGGKLTYKVTTTPGTPIVQSSTGSITCAQLKASAFGTRTCAQVDPTLTVLDTRLISL